jgi:hypothetical protein
MNQNYLGAVGSDSTLGPSDQRYFYAIRTDEEGNIFINKIDMWTSSEAIEINKPGEVEDDWQYFELGVDYFDGKNPETHIKDNPNLNFDQYRFDSRSVYYYINANGELIARYNQSYDYSTDV